MASISVSQNGKVRRLLASGSYITPTQAANSVSTGLKPSFFQYQGNIYAVGAWDRGVMLDFYSQQCYTMGIAAPTAAATLAIGAAGTISTDTSVGYYSYLHKIGTYTLDESPLSPASNELAPVTSDKISWSGLPTAAPAVDSKVTHLRLYRADDGDAPRAIEDVALGSSTYTDDTATLALGAYAELDDIGSPVENLKYSATYSERGWYAGDPVHPDRIYYSRIGYPQSVGEDSYMATREGEAVTGIRKIRDQLFVGCRNCSYSIQLIPGTTNAFVIEKISPSIGVLSHWGMVNIYDRLWFPSKDGVFIYDGSFRMVSSDIWHLWRQEYHATSNAFFQMEAEHDPYRKIYKLKYLKDPSSAIDSRYFCASYANFEPTVAGQGEGQPAWSMDFRGRRDTAMGMLSFGNGPLQLYTGSTDGIIREENDETDADDDGDTYAKALFIQTGIDWGSVLDTDPENGRSIHSLRAYVESESTAWTIQVLGGDEGGVNINEATTATDNLLGWWKFAVAASAKTYIYPDLGATRYSYTASAKTHHHFVPERVSGRGLNIVITATSPVGFRFRGWGATTLPGPTSRPWATKVTTASSTTT